MHVDLGEENEIGPLSPQSSVSRCIVSLKCICCISAVNTCMCREVFLKVNQLSLYFKFRSAKEEII